MPQQTYIYISCILLLLFPVDLSSNTLGDIPCPTIAVQGAPDVMNGETKHNLEVYMTNVDPSSKPTYKWCVSSGTITSGQGTKTIEVDVSDSKEEQVTVTIIVGGIDKDCANVASYHITRSGRIN